MKTALVYFTGFSANVGGSEWLLFSLIRELQECYDVTLALSGGGDIAKAVGDYGVHMDLNCLKVLRLHHIWWRRQLRRVGRSFDICISCSNPVDFGRPGIHFVNMLTLDSWYYIDFWFRREGRRIPYKIRLAAIRDEVVRVLSGARSAPQIVRDCSEIVLPNSIFAKKSIETRYRCRVHDAFYPPTLFVPANAVCRAQFDIACLGRVNFEKRVDAVIAIVESARKKSGMDFRLRIAGRIYKTPFGLQVMEMATQRAWVKLEGELTGTAKAKYLSECTYAIHACTCEAFGISITEYLKAGLVPVVPREGGSSEVVGLDSLVYADEEEAADILVRLATDEAFRKECLSYCANHAKLFTAEAYSTKQSRLMEELEIKS